VRASAGAIALTTALAALASAGARAFDAKTVEFSVTVHGERSAFRDVAAFALPGATMPIVVAGPPGDYVVTTSQVGTIMQRGLRTWEWHAPKEPGLYELRVDGPAKKDTIELHAFVMVPAARVRSGLLNGYRIGDYPATPLDGNPMYRPPAGFVEVTKENQETRLSPHFRLKQFLCKEDTSKAFPKYVVVQPRLLLKLEALLARVNALGFQVETLHVMSAYRTPFYNHAIGDVRYSMHQWGSAADIYVDPDNSGRMQDLNGDHRVDVGDAKYLYDRIERMLVEPDFRQFEGGLGFYPATAAHPPFVHVDVRGVKARWRG